jgi:hypothetical protein
MRTCEKRRKFLSKENNLQTYLEPNRFNVNIRCLVSLKFAFLNFDLYAILTQFILRFVRNFYFDLYAILTQFLFRFVLDFTQFRTRLLRLRLPARRKRLCLNSNQSLCSIFALFEVKSLCSTIICSTIICPNIICTTIICLKIICSTIICLTKICYSF